MPTSQNEPYIPTPEEIRAGCRIIQSEWSEKERYRREGRPERVEIQQAKNRMLTGRRKPPIGSS